MKKIFAFFNLSLQSRIIITAALYAVCVLIQILSGFAPAGLVLLIPAWLLLAMKNIKNKPDDQGLENWRPVGSAEIHRIADTLSQTKKLQRQISGPGCLLIFGWFGSFILAVLFRFFADYSVFSHISLAFLDFGLFTVPAVLSGNVHLFMPYELNMKMDHFLPLMNESLPPGYILTPYVRFDEDKEKKEIPEDLRCMLELKRKPEALVGVQLQIAINKGPNGNVPYMYAVVLMRGRSSQLYRTFASISVAGYEIEPGGDDQYGTVVIRQKTSGTGYHTKADDCRRLFAIVLKALQQIVPSA